MTSLRWGLAGLVLTTVGSIAQVGTTLRKVSTNPSARYSAVRGRGECSASLLAPIIGYAGLANPSAKQLSAWKWTRTLAPLVILSAFTGLACASDEGVGAPQGESTGLTGTDPSGAPLNLRIAAVQADWQDPSGDITLYAIETRSGATGVWQNICSPDPWGERWAIAVAGRWDESGTHQPDPAGFTFACTSGVIAKCVRWGYKPWKTLNGTDLAPYHQACTRMARADYCGDGTAHTVNGTLIDLYDTLGIQARTPDVTDMFFEGTWTPDGAYCLGKVRWQNLAVTEPEGVCYKKLKWLSGTLLNDIDECEVKVQPSLKRSVLLYNRSRLNSL